MVQEPLEITLTVRGDPEQVRELMQRVFGPVSPTVTHQGGTANTGGEKLEWTPELLSALWEEVRSDGARRILAEIATSPAPVGYPISQLSERLGIRKKDVGGIQSSIGFALKRSFKGLPDPRNVNWAIGKYMMDANVANIILELAARDYV